MTELDAVKAETLKILRIAGRLRASAPRREAKDAAVLSTRLDRPLRGRGEPSPDANAAQAFQEAIRFWALRVAPLVTFKEWEAMVDEVARQAPEYPGDVVRFFENRFDGLSLKDGSVILS